MQDTWLLKKESAQRLYLEHAKELPIIDFHNHIAISDLARDRRYSDVGELWLAPDPYKHRLMRICGVPEQMITGEAEPFEKFRAYCGIFPYLAGSPVYDWSRMELSQIFGIDTLPTEENARRIWDECGEKLASREFSARGLLSRFHIEYQAPVATLLEDLSLFDGERVAPSLRADELLSPTKELIAALSQRTGMEIGDTDSYVAAIEVMLDRFDAAGCRFADHALDSGFFEADTDGKRCALLVRLGAAYARRGWTLLLHLDAKRQTSTRLARCSGRFGGYAAVGGGFPVSAVCNLLDAMERGGGLPDTVLMPLNMNDQVPLAVLQGSFAEDGISAKVQLGPAWWWCDHAMGIVHTLDCIASFGVASQFIGMTTDSRSILSFVRHDYFRRLLCSWLDERNESLAWELPRAVQGEIVRKICYENVKMKLRGKRYEKNV